MPKLRAFWVDESGQDMVEYALLLMLVCVSAFGLLNVLRAEAVQTWQAISHSFAVGLS